MTLHGYQIHADAKTGTVLHYAQVRRPRFATEL
jgi:hypothetical protein